MSNRNIQIEQLYNLAERLGGDDGAIVNAAIGLIECSIKERADANQFVTIVVLNDGETFTDISGCSVCIIPQEDYERVIAEGGDARDFSPVVEIGLDNMTLPMSFKDHNEFEDALARARALARRQALDGAREEMSYEDHIAFEDENEDEAWDHGGALGQFEREEGEDN